MLILLGMDFGGAYRQAREKLGGEDGDIWKTGILFGLRRPMKMDFFLVVCTGAAANILR